MAHIRRRELKEDQLRTTYEEFEDFVRKNHKEIATIAGIAVVVVGLAVGLKHYQGRREAEANEALGTALKTFGAYVGTLPQNSLMPGLESYPTAQEKYKKALGEFQEVVQKYSRTPEPKAVAVARYHIGLCQGLLGDQDAAIKTLQEAATESDRNIAALAQFALAGEYVKSGKVEEGARIYQELAARPTDTVPEATAKLALANAYRETQPAKAREIYQQLEKQFSENTTIAQAVKDQMASLPE